jgi:hypothetical protein
LRHGGPERPSVSVATGKHKPAGLVKKFLASFADPCHHPAVNSMNDS